VQFELFGEDLFVSQIVTEAGQCGRVVERRCAQAAVFRVVDRHMARDTRAAAIPYEHDLVAARVGFRRARRIQSIPWSSESGVPSWIVTAVPCNSSASVSK